jgi:hypothetical protein
MWIAAFVAGSAPLRAEPTAPPSPGRAPVEVDPPLGEALRRRVAPDSQRPPPLQMEYAQYGVAITSAFNLSVGGPPAARRAPALHPRWRRRPRDPRRLPLARSLVLRRRLRVHQDGLEQPLPARGLPAAPRGGALRARSRLRAAPYVTAGLGALVYGNEWQVQTGGAIAFVGAGDDLRGLSLGADRARALLSSCARRGVDGHGRDQAARRGRAVRRPGASARGAHRDRPALGAWGSRAGSPMAGVFSPPPGST